MIHNYFGLICDSCTTAFPLGEEESYHHNFATTTHVLHCPECKTAVRHEAFKHWSSETRYTANEIAIAHAQIRSVPRPI